MKQPFSEEALQKVSKGLKKLIKQKGYKNVQLPEMDDYINSRIEIPKGLNYFILSDGGIKIISRIFEGHYIPPPK